VARRALLSILILATPALAGEWTQWPLRQLLVVAFERSCEVTMDERPDHVTLANILADRFPNDPDALAMSAALLAANDARPERADDLNEAQERLALAERIALGRPMEGFAHGTLALALARHAAGLAERNALLERADRELAAVSSGAGVLPFYARAARMSVALERGDAAALKLHASEAIVVAREAGVPREVEYRLRLTYERRMADLDQAHEVYREARYLERARSPRIRRFNPGWTDLDEAIRTRQMHWSIWSLVADDRPEEALARIDRQSDDGWFARMAAMARLELGAPAPALDAAKRARNQDGTHAEKELVAECLIALGRAGEARSALEALGHEEDGKRCARCLALLARAAALSGRDEKAEALARRAEAADDGSRDVLLASAAAARRRGELEEANALGARAFSAGAKAEEQALQREEAACKRALDYGRFEEAEEHAASFLARRPSSQRALRLLAVATARHGDPRAPFLLELLDDPQDAWIVFQRGKERALRGQLDDARADLEHALALFGARPADARDVNAPGTPQEVSEARALLRGVEQSLRPRPDK
jgi:hypothetical protein